MLVVRIEIQNRFLFSKDNVYGVVNLSVNKTNSYQTIPFALHMQYAVPFRYSIKIIFSRFFLQTTKQKRKEKPST